MSPAIPLATPLPVGATIAPNSLRAAMEARRARGERFTLKEAAGLIIPLCLDLANRHAEGGRFFLHPSSIEVGEAQPRVKPLAPAGGHVSGAVSRASSMASNKVLAIFSGTPGIPRIARKSATESGCWRAI